MKNFLESLGAFALFRGRETEPGSPSTTGGVSVRLDAGSGVQSAAETVHDGDTVHGSELPGRVHSAARSAAGTLAQKRARPDFIAFVLSYFFGSCESQVFGGGYSHFITPSADLELPSFTLVQRRGRDIFTERLAGNYIDSFRLDLKEGFAALSAEVVGAGAREVNYERESITAPGNATTLTLGHAVAGASAAERLANFYRVRARLSGSQAWLTAVAQEVSGDNPAVVTLAAAVGGSSDNAEFQVDYLPPAPDWCVLPPEVDESPLRLIDAKVLVGGWWNGVTIVGGEELGPRLVSLSVSGRNNLELRRFPGNGGPAAHARRGARELTIALSEELRDSVRTYAADHPDLETLSVTVNLAGATVEGGFTYNVGVHFPRCAVLAAPVAAESGRLSTNADLIVLDDGEGWGGGGAIIWNQQTGYLI